MDFIQKQNPAVRLLQKSRLVGLRPGVGAFDVAKQLAHQQLRVMGIISAIELDEWRGLRQFSGLDAVFVQQIGEQRFPYASLAQQEHMHAVPRIKDGSLPLFDLMEQARITLQELVHVHHFRRFLRYPSLWYPLVGAWKKAYRSGLLFVAALFFVQPVQVARNIAAITLQPVGNLFGRYPLLLLFIKHAQCLKHFLDPLQKSSLLRKAFTSSTIVPYFYDRRIQKRSI